MSDIKNNAHGKYPETILNKCRDFSTEYTKKVPPGKGGIRKTETASDSD
jgi:hypothetical protein